MTNYTWSNNGLPLAANYPDPSPELAFCVVAAVRDLQAHWTELSSSLEPDSREAGRVAGVHQVLGDLQRRIAQQVLDRLGDQLSSDG